MAIRNIIDAIIALLGLASFATALFFLMQGHDKEWITLILAPLSGICLAVLARRRGAGP